MPRSKIRVIRPIAPLMTLTIDYIAKNVSLYRNCLKYLPPHAKETILRKIVRNCTIAKNLNSNDILTELFHPRLKCVDLSSVRVDDNILDALNVCKLLTVISLRNFEPHTFTSNGLIKLFQETPKLLVLNVCHSDQFNDQVLEVLSIHCKNIRQLNFEGCSITDTGLATLAHHNKVIQCLTVADTHVTGPGVTEAVKDKNWPCLLELRVDSCSKIDDNVLKTVIQNCSKIEVITFYNCAITDQTSLFQDITKKCKKLKQLYWTISW